MSISNVIVLGQPSAGLGQGDPNEHITGTKTSGPRGIESIIEYNSLLMNIREWEDTYLITTINGIDDADVRDERQANPGQHGETPGQSLYGGRTIVLQGKIQTRTLWKLRDMQQALRGAFSDLSVEKALIFRSNDIQSDQLIFCKKIGKIEMPENQSTLNNFERNFQITLRASNPRFVGYREFYKTAAVPIPAGVVYSIINDGNFDAQPKIRIYGEASATVNGGRAVTISNDTNRMVMFIKALPGSTVPIAADRYIEIDIAKRQMNEYVTATGAFVGNAFNRLETGSDWLELDPGLNSVAVSYTASSGGAEAQFRWRDTFM